MTTQLAAIRVSDGSPGGLLVGLLPRFFRSPAACPARRTERASAYLLVPSAHQWLAQLAGPSAHRLTSSFLPLVSGSPDGSLVGLLPLPSAHQWLARLAERSANRLTSSFLPLVGACPARRTYHLSTYFLVPSAHQWLARLAGWITHRLTSSFLPLVSGLTDGS